jgi:hemerythrin
MNAITYPGTDLPTTGKRRQPYPGWLYKALPYIYLWGGFWVIVLLPGWLSVFSGLTLMSAAGVVWMYREHYRRNHAQQPSGAQARVMATGSPEATVDSLNSGGAPDVGNRDPAPVARVHPLVPAWVPDVQVPRCEVPASVSMGAESAPQALVATAAVTKAGWRKSIECGCPTLDAQRLGLFTLCSELLEIVLGEAPRSETQRMLDRLVGQIAEHLASESDELAKVQRPLSMHSHSQRNAMLDKANGFRDRFQGGDWNVHAFIKFVTYDVIAVHLADRGFPASPGLLATEK